MGGAIAPPPPPPLATLLKSCNTAMIFFRRIFESSHFSAVVVKLRILFWLLKATAFNYCISKHVRDFLQLPVNS